MDKNISVWRGVIAPPTHTHLWIKDDTNIYIYRERQWTPLYDEASSECTGFMSKTDKQILDELNENLHWN